MIETLHIIHHSHTDIGFTNEQPVVWDLHDRIIDAALDNAEADEDRQSEDAFRWTCECVAPVVHWFQHASAAQRARFIRLEQAGRIEVAGLFLGWTPLYDRAQLEESLGWVDWLRREFGLTIRAAMACDVNGHNESLVEGLLDAGIAGFSMAINADHGRALRGRAFPFRWQGPSGRDILAWNGFTYGHATFSGFHGPDFNQAEKAIAQLETELHASSYSLPIMMFQGIHPYGDNGSAWPELAQFAQRWNRENRTPRIVMSTPARWFDALNQFRDRLPILRGDWTDYWNFGCASSARETAVARRNNARLLRADTLHALTGAAGIGDERSRERSRRHRGNAWWQQHVWVEHTWSADCAAEAPDSIDAVATWHHKADAVWKAHSLSTLLQRDGLVDLAGALHVPADKIFLFNPLPWDRVVGGTLPARVQFVRGNTPNDTASKLQQDRKLDVDPLDGPVYDGGWPHQYPESFIPITRVPALGHTLIDRAEIKKTSDVVTRSDTHHAENHRHRMTFNPCGHMTSWKDTGLGCEWVDPAQSHVCGGYIHEEVAVRDHPWPRSLQFNQGKLVAFPGMADPVGGWRPDWPVLRRPMTRCLFHECQRFPHGTRIVQRWEAPGLDGVLNRRIFLPDYADWVELEFDWINPRDPHPHGQYITLPFALPNATPMADIGSIAINPLQDRLPGSCADYFTSQGWVDLSNADRGMIIATPDNPLYMLGGFHFAAMQDQRTLGDALFLGWITNNYWQCNFPVTQPGRIQARYRLLPHVGKVNPVIADRFAREAALNTELMNYGGYGTGTGNSPTQATWLRLPETIDASTSIKTLQLQPTDQPGQVILKLINLSDQTATATIEEGLLTIESIQEIDCSGHPVGRPTPVQGRVTINIPGHRISRHRCVLRPLQPSPTTQLPRKK